MLYKKSNKKQQAPGAQAEKEKYALKGQNQIAQGIALGIVKRLNKSPVRA